MPRPILLLAALAAVVAVMAVRLAPAAIVDSRLAQITDGGLRLGDTAGTVWDGRGNLQAGTTQMPVAWRIDAWPLLRGQLRLRLVPDWGAVPGMPRADIALQGGHLALRDVDLTVPAGLLNALAGSPANWGVGGDADVTAAAIDWTPPANQGAAQVRWRRARLIFPGGAASLDLGDVSMALIAAGDRVSGPVSNAGGDLAIRGEVALRAMSGIQLSLVLTPRRIDNRELAQALSVLGAPEGDGWHVDWRVPFR